MIPELTEIQIKELEIELLKEKLRVIENENKELKKQYAINVVSKCKRDETLELLEEMMNKVKEANEEVENGIYDPMLEVAKHILNNYKIERR